MTGVVNREQLIERARAAIHEYDIAKAHRVSITPDRMAILLAEFLAVFEQALTPSGDDQVSRAINALSWRPDHDGSDPARVHEDYMRRAQAADEALAILTHNREGAF